MKFFVTSILVVLTSNLSSGFLFGGGLNNANNNVPRVCVISSPGGCNEIAPLCARSTTTGLCKLYRNNCGLQSDNCQVQQYYQVGISQCDGLRNGQSGRCLIINYVNGNGQNRNRRNRNRRSRNRRNRNRNNGNQGVVRTATN